MGQKQHKSPPLLVVAFDFGTTFSGYAFSFREEPLKVLTNENWSAESKGFQSLKTPTCVLLNPSGAFDSFGFQAEDKYLSLLDDGDHDGWRLFRRFKMSLHGNKTLSRALTVGDIEGKPMRALPIFTMSIKYLRDHFIEAVIKQADGILETDVQYILTVPAIWDDKAKQFMREAAVKAGIDTNRLMLALEPEAASMWCENVNIEAQTAFSGSGAQYMVIDLGGGTADISVHEKKSDGSLKEIHRASGGPWGGIYVDQSYLDMLTAVFGYQAMQDFKSEAMSDYYDVMREFETKKRTFTSQSVNKMNFRISAAMKDCSEKVKGQKLKEIVSSTEYGEKISLHGKDKLRIDPDIVRKWFDGPVGSVIKHVKELLAEPRMESVRTILLVGGFGGSPYVQERMKKEIVNRTFIVPVEPGLVVLRGAVRFGHAPGIVSSRVMKYTYGIASTRDFDKTNDSESMKKIINGQAKVCDIFSIFVTADEEIGNEHQVKKILTPNSRNSFFSIYRTAGKSPAFVTDSGCEHLGTLEINRPQNMSLVGEETTVTFLFGKTELVVKVRSKKTGIEEHKTLDCFK